MNYCYANISILFADDDETAKNHYAEYLGQLFHNVYAASDGEQAWKQYQIYRPDIILLDIEMPKINGLALAKKIRKEDKRARIIIATAHVDEHRLLQAVELNLTRFLPKPFGRQALKEALSKAVHELDTSPRIKLGAGYEWEIGTLKLYLHENELRLTGSEQALMTLLAEQPNHVVSPYMIEVHLWPNEDDSADNAARLKTLVKRLRKKLPEGAIENIYGEGYRLKTPC